MKSVKILKFILGIIYWVAIIKKLFLYKNKILTSLKLKTPLISIGNITAGGTGKTPMVIYISNLITKLNFSHSIISRGYGRKTKKQIVVNDGLETIGNISDSGDEALVLSQKLKNIPIVVGKKFEGCLFIEKTFYSNMILMDDGFQTFHMARDLNILLIDISSNINEYKLLPVGRLREPLSGIERADCIIFTKTNFASCTSKKIEKKILKHIKPNKQKIFRSSFNLSLLKYDKIKDQFFSVENTPIDGQAVAFSGLGNPTSFNKFVKSKFKTIKVIEFRDHCKYDKYEFTEILLMEGLGTVINHLVTTLKDFVKIKKRLKNSNKDVYIVDVELKIENETEFINFFKKQLNII